MKIKVPLQCHQSAIESAIKYQRFPRSNRVSAISAVESPLPPLRARTHAQGDVICKVTALTALPRASSPLTCGNASAINGTGTALPHQGAS